MRLAKNKLLPFVGGYLEIQADDDEEENYYLYYGKIKSFSMQRGNMLWIHFEWLLIGDGFPGKVTWRKTDPLPYVTILDNFTEKILKKKEIKKGKFGLFSSTHMQWLVFRLPKNPIIDKTMAPGFQVK